MFSKRSAIYIILITLISFSLACSLTGTAEERPENPPKVPSDGDTIATAVAATLVAIQAANGENPPPTTHPTVTASAPPAPEANFNDTGVSFYFNEALAENIVAGVNPSMIDQNLWWSVPEHREFRFNNWVLVDTFLPAVIKIYPVADFRDINPGVGERLDGLLEVLANKPPDGEGVSVGDIFNAGQMFKSNVGYLKTQNGEGIRFLTQYGQALWPIGWPMMFYTFQGFTDDGLYFISAMLPATHPSLPDPEQVTMDQDFMDNWETYVADLEAQLNAESDVMFQPPLALLDQIFESMTVGSP